MVCHCIEGGIVAEKGCLKGRPTGKSDHAMETQQARFRVEVKRPDETKEWNCDHSFPYGGVITK
jgi:hypothetical protein